MDRSGHSKPRQLLDADVRMTALYREWLAERDEILRHKWLESERRGYDIGFERALINWILYHRSGWMQSRMPVAAPCLQPAGGALTASAADEQSPPNKC